MQFFMKHLYHVLMSWPEDMDMLWFCFCFLFCKHKLFHDSSYRQIVAGDINSLNLLVFEWIFLSFAGINDTHKSLNELEYSHNQPPITELAALECLKYSCIML